MKKIDIENWNRKKHYHFFKGVDYPHFNICANIDITEFMSHIRAEGYPFFLSTVYATTRVANDIKEFRYRMRDDEVVEHDAVNPSFTIMSDDDVFGFCHAKYNPDFKAFLMEAKLTMEEAKSNADLEDEDLDNVLYMTSLPWVSFTSVSHPIHMNPVDCIPRIAWGKYFEENDRILIPVSVQVHHALVDGSHAGDYFVRLQNFMNNASSNL